MADMLNTRPLDHSVTEIDYKPISGWAVAALVIAGTYCVIVGIIAITALYERRAAISVAWLILPVLGLVFSIVARVHIKRSEGTRAGLRQAAIAWWLCIVGGAAFGAYLFASKLALEQQAEHATNEWFDLLKQSKSNPLKLNEAFLQTIEPLRRQGVDPNNAAGLDATFGAGPLPAFRNSELVRLFERNGEDVNVRLLGVSNWQQIDAGYQIDYSYQVRSPEGLANLNLVLFGSEGKNIAGREWHIVMPQGGLTIQSVTTYGRLLYNLQEEARGVAQTWIRAFPIRESADLYVLTLPPSNQSALGAVFSAIQLGVQVSTGLPTPLLTLSSIPNVTVTAEEVGSDDIVIRALHANGFFSIGMVTEEKKARLRESLRIRGLLKAGESRMINAETSPQIVVTPQEIRYIFPVELVLPGRPASYCGGRLVIVSQSPRLLAELNDLYAKGKSNPDAKDETSANILAQRPSREWRVLRFETNLEPLAAPKQSPGGPPKG